MGARRAKLPVLAEISGAASGDSRAWSLRRSDYDTVASLLGQLQAQRVLLVTGAEAAIDAVAVALAGAATATGRRTALVECELARPLLAAELGLAAAPGLHEYLLEEASAAELLQPLTLAGPASAGATHPLVCIAGGRPAGDGTKLLAGGGFRHAVAKLRAAYELVILAGPRLDGERDAVAAAAGEADGVLACLAPAQLSGRAGRATRAALKRLPGGPVAGAVLVGADAAQRS